MPSFLALTVNLSLASVAGLMFHFLPRWQYGRADRGHGAFRRAAMVVFPQALMVYGVVLVISNLSVSIQLSVVIPVVALIFVILLIVRDPEVSFTERDQRILFPSVVAVGIVSTALGVLLVVGIYLSPDLPSVLPDHNLISSWQINFDELGYSRAEALEQVNLGYMWHAMALMGYMMFVLGGSLFVAVYRIGGGGWSVGCR